MRERYLLINKLFDGLDSKKVEKLAADVKIYSEVMQLILTGLSEGKEQISTSQHIPNEVLDTITQKGLNVHQSGIYTFINI